eukprot:TRINITY_DN11468_c0_g1_i1.p1 TRINITY_DN11468_c0_g1~~TRINITY_DN11468_c0_g1_i1.p1  ORF type:complete len:356 (-),score=85.34 TRINITY_DN11468_c0_g1_i1:488-1555(-)
MALDKGTCSALLNFRNGSSISISISSSRSSRGPRFPMLSRIEKASVRKMPPVHTLLSSASASHALFRAQHSLPDALGTRKRNATAGSLRLSRNPKLVPNGSDFTFASWHPWTKQPWVRCSSSADFVSQGQDAYGRDDAEEDPYKVLGITPLSGFDAAKNAHRKKIREAERAGDQAAIDRYERAYNKIMMKQLDMRMRGVTFGSLEVSKDIKYADAYDFIPWRPREAKSSKNDVLINFAISLVFGGWVVAAKVAEWKPLQFMVFCYVFRIFTKLKEFQPPVLDDAEKKRQQNGQRLLRTLGLCFGTVAVAATAHSLLVQFFAVTQAYVPRSLFNNLELFVTAVSSVLLFVIASYYR